jgi:hypothetical protein
MLALIAARNAPCDFEIACPDLIWASIFFAREMDCRVKPGNDE